MKRLKPLPIMLVLMFMTFPIVIILMSHHITLSETLSKMDSGALGDAYTLITLPEGDVSPENLFSMVDQLSASIGIYSDSETEADVKIRSIYFTKDYVTIPMQSGRFFIHADFQKDNYAAVIGKALVPQTYSLNQTQYIDVNGLRFHVIGVIGYERDTVWDHTVFINGYVQPSVFHTKLYMIDFFNQESEALTQTLLQSIHDQYGVEGNVLSGSKSFLTSFLPRVLYARWFLVILFCNILSIALLSLEWLQRKKTEFCIKRLLGATAGGLIVSMCLQYGFLLGIAFSLSAVYCRFIYPAYINSLGIGFLLFLPIAFAWMTISAWLLLKTPIREGIN